MTDNERINYLVRQVESLAKQMRELQSEINIITEQIQELKEKK